MVERVRLIRKTRSESKVVSSAPPPWRRLFGHPNVLGGEDAAAYEELLARFRAAVNPVDIIEEMLIADVVASEWEVLRWRRLSSVLIQNCGYEALQGFLVEQFESNYALHEEHFKGYLAKILQNSLPEEQADSAEMLAAECTPNNADANDKLEKVLSGIGLDTNTVLDEARADKAEELVQEYVRGEREAVTLVNKLLTDVGKSMDSFMTQVLRDRIDEIERIDRLTAIAETRRNAALREIDRRREGLGQTLRRGVHEIEHGHIADGELLRVLPAAEGENAA
jgi:hypothetical protein